MRDLKHVTIYTDGACVGNPGPGGYGVILIYKAERKELRCGYHKTTNNRMEIRAAIAGLESLKERCQVTLYSDSQYLVKAMSQGWAQRWHEKGWKRNKRDKALNPDLWNRLLDLCECHEVEFRWVLGHEGNAENECCDQLAMQGALGSDLRIDEGYEQEATGV